MESESFVPQEYIAACKYNSSYVGYCDITGYVFYDTNNNGVWDKKDKRLHYNTSCNAKYESTVKPHVNAFVSNCWSYDKHCSSTPVFYFKYDEKNSKHVSQKIDETLYHNVS